MRRLALALLLSSTACYSQPDGFVTAVAKHNCKRIRECNRSVFDQKYDGDLNACRDEQEGIAQDAFDLADSFDCEYVPKEGRECIAALRHNRSDCSEDAEQEIFAQCGLNSDLSVDYFDCP